MSPVRRIKKTIKTSSFKTFPVKDLLTEILFYLVPEFQNEQQHHQAFCRHVLSDGYAMQNC